MPSLWIKGARVIDPATKRDGVGDLFVTDGRIASSLSAAAKKRAKQIDGRRVFYPGERALQARAENMAHGIAVDPEVWRRVQAL